MYLLLLSHVTLTYLYLLLTLVYHCAVLYGPAFRKDTTRIHLSSLPMCFGAPVPRRSPGFFPDHLITLLTYLLTYLPYLLLLRFKTATVQFRQESYGAYRPRPAAQLLSVHPGSVGSNNVGSCRKIAHVGPRGHSSSAPRAERAPPCWPRPCASSAGSCCGSCCGSWLG